MEVLLKVPMRLLKKYPVIPTNSMMFRIT